MKKIISLILIITFMSAALFGCGKEKVSETYLINVESHYQYTENANQPYWTRDYIKKVENGYYYFWCGMLYFFDISSETAFLLCSSPDCDHSGIHCNAYLGLYGFNGDYWTNDFLALGLEVTDTYIYTIGMEMSEVTDYYLYRISRDGTKREKLFYLYSVDTSYHTYEYKMHQNYLYRSVYMYDEEKSYLEKISFDNKTEIIFDAANYYNSDIGSIIAYDDYVYFDTTWFENEEKTKLIARIYRYHIKTGKIELILDDFICNKFLLVDDTTFIYMDLDYNIFKKDIKTGKEIIMRPAPDDYFEFSYDGLYLYAQIYSKEKRQECVEVYDLEGNLIDIVEINNGTCIFGDSDYLFVDAMSTPIGIDSKSNYGFYALPKSQIGSANKKWILLGQLED